MLVIDALREGKNFTPSEEALVSYILENPDKALRLTIQELAEKSFVSKPTIIRLYRKLGYDSYNDFRIAFFSQQKSLKNDETVDESLPFDESEDSMDIARNLAALTRQVTENNMAILDGNNLNNIVNAIYESNRIFIFAIGDSQIEAEAFKNKLVKLDIYPIIISEYSDYMAHIYNMEVNDCVIAVSFSGKLFMGNSRQIKAICDSPAKSIMISALSKKDIPFEFDYYLQLAGDENNFDKIATFSSQIAISYIFNLLYSCIYAKEYENNRKYTQKYIDFITARYK